ncbi:MAG: hypothetical protein ACOC4K_03310 [Verrucomicrobiota bacterium]
MQPSIDHLLAPVAQVCRHAADDILDLREALMTRSDPGECVQCYFKIFDVLRTRDPAPLQKLRDWLESHLVVVARDGKARELERLPVSLHQGDMESFCRELMNEFHHNRSYPNTLIELQLHFDDRAAV